MPRISIGFNSVAFDQVINFTVDVGTAAGRTIAVYATSTENTLTSATIDGVAATIQDSILNDATKTSYLLYVTGITSTGLVNVSLTYNAGGGTKRYQYVGYNEIGSIRGHGKAKASSNAPSVTITTVANDLAVLMGWDGDFGATFAASSPAVAFSTGGLFGAEETATGTSTVIDGTLSAGGVPWAAFAIALVPAGAASTTLDGVGTATTVAAGQFPPPVDLAGNGVSSATGSGALAIPAITTNPFKNNAGTLLASSVIPKVGIYKLSDLTLVVAFTNQTTNASGQLYFQDNGLAAGVDYLVVTSDATGAAVGVSKNTAV